jgi:hypothetical protein
MRLAVSGKRHSGRWVDMEEVDARKKKLFFATSFFAAGSIQDSFHRPEATYIHPETIMLIKSPTAKTLSINTIKYNIFYGLT